MTSHLGSGNRATSIPTRTSTSFLTAGTPRHELHQVQLEGPQPADAATASVLQNSERRRAYGTLDVRLARAAPLAAVDFLKEPTLVSKRVGRIVLRPVLDLTAVCLK